MGYISRMTEFYIRGNSKNLDQNLTLEIPTGECEPVATFLFHTLFGRSPDEQRSALCGICHRQQELAREGRSNLRFNLSCKNVMIAENIPFDAPLAGVVTKLGQCDVLFVSGYPGAAPAPCESGLRVVCAKKVVELCEA
jgi:hypothetical protein